MGCYYNKTMNHKMKDKDTGNKINPTCGLWLNSVIYTTSNERSKPIAYADPYLKKEFNIKKNPFKTWEEENQKFKNMGKKVDKEKKDQPVKN